MIRGATKERGKHMDLMDAIKGRRSIRKYKPDPVPEEAMIRRYLDQGKGSGEPKG